ncbi:MAG: hypothetical protein ACR652_15020 [Methylocystis sp.]|uniref:hypothetical protein n=1 Tax=Methylocystis sp. TaxID=1911079 RepID=UPI003DA668D6
MAAETPTGEAPTTYCLALRQRDRLAGLAYLAERAHSHEGAFGEHGDGIVRLLNDAANAAAELFERLRTEKTGERHD